MAFNRLADSQSKQLAALSVEHGGDTALTVNIGVSDGGREGNPQSQRSPPQSDRALGLGSSPKAARRPYLCFSALCHLHLHRAPWAAPPWKAHLQLCHSTFQVQDSHLSSAAERKTLSKQLSAGRAQRAVHCPLTGAWSLRAPLVHLAS